MFASATRALSLRTTPRALARFQSSSSSSANPHRIFVARLALSVDDTQLAEAFSHCGEVVSAHVSRNQASGASRGFGHVHFTSAQGVERALREMEGIEIQGRAIRLDYSRAASSTSAGSSKTAASEHRTTREPSDTLWVGNVGYETTKETIEAFWKDHEGFQRVTIPQTRDGAGSGMAFVKFADVESAQRAKDAVGRVGEAVLDGRRLVVDFAAPHTRRNSSRRRDSEEEDGEYVPELGRVGFALEEWVRVLNRNARDSSV